MTKGIKKSLLFYGVLCIGSTLSFLVLAGQGGGQKSNQYQSDLQITIPKCSNRTKEDDICETSKNVIFEKINGVFGETWIDRDTGIGWRKDIVKFTSHNRADGQCKLFGGYLPSIAEIQQAEKNGLKEVFKDFSRFFWSSTQDINKTASFLYFDACTNTIDSLHYEAKIHALCAFNSE